MKIRVTEERECCQPKDLLPYKGLPIGGLQQHLHPSFCKHCGQMHERHGYTDAAGGSDWEWKKVKLVEKGTE